MAKPKNILVRYDFQCGEHETCCATLIEDVSGKTPRQIVHEYFKKFWSETETVEKCRRYYGFGGVVAVKITGFEEVPERDATVLKKYRI